MFRYYALHGKRRVELMDWNGCVFGGFRVARRLNGIDGAVVRVEPNR